MALTGVQSLGLEDSYAKLNLDDEEEGGLVFDDISGEEGLTGFQWFLVGHFLTNRSINFVAMKNTLASICRSVKGVYIKDLSPSLFYSNSFMSWILSVLSKEGHGGLINIYRSRAN